MRVARLLPTTGSRTLAREIGHCGFPNKTSACRLPGHQVTTRFAHLAPAHSEYRREQEKAEANKCSRILNLGPIFAGETETLRSSAAPSGGSLHISIRCP